MKNWPQATIMFSGTLLVLIGVLADCGQLYVELLILPKVPVQPRPNDIRVTTNEFSATTRFAGIELVIVGAMLQVIGYLGTVPWRKPEKSN